MNTSRERSPVLTEIKRVLGRLRETLTGRVEQAYTERDAKGATGEAQSYAAGEAHAYGVAEGDVRRAEKEQQQEA